MDHFLVAVTSGARMEVEISAAVGRLGLEIKSDHSATSIGCVDALMAVYRSWGSPKTNKHDSGGADAVERTVRILMDSWPDTRDGLSHGVGEGHGRHRQRLRTEARP